MSAAASRVDFDGNVSVYAYGIRVIVQQHLVYAYGIRVIGHFIVCKGIKLVLLVDVTQQHSIIRSCSRVEAMSNIVEMADEFVEVLEKNVKDHNLKVQQQHI
ncbi:hypothetical protein HHK36_029134 [Tetracentron sinense]|uniref:Uncharacterized protein n=1 Tax=Tetracentron sinense TaxID=13715 RepID=A0A835D1B2_TETSI|nr:hypothetical protein HHK36_029134 [Tetracentron sinense]